MRSLVLLGTFGLCSLTLGCTSNETPPPPAKDGANAPEVVPPKPEPQPEPKVPEPEPEPGPTVAVTIASVQMIQDCPTGDGASRPNPAATTPAPAPGGTAHPGRAARGVGSSLTGHGPRQPCTQSTMQLVFSSHDDGTEHVEISAVRMLDPTSGKELATLVAREPAAWADGAYLSWDQTLAPRQEVKTSYALSVPDWTAVEGAIGSSYGVMFVLEVDVKVGDEQRTVRSAEFPRERPHVIVT